MCVCSHPAAVVDLCVQICSEFLGFSDLFAQGVIVLDQTHNVTPASVCTQPVTRDQPGRSVRTRVRGATAV